MSRCVAGGGLIPIRVGGGGGLIPARVGRGAAPLARLSNRDSVRLPTETASVYQQRQREWRRLRRCERRRRARRQRPRPRRRLWKELIMCSSETKSDISLGSVNLTFFFNCAVKSLKSLKITTKSGLTDPSISFLYTVKAMTEGKIETFS